MGDETHATGDAVREIVSRGHRRLDELFGEVEAAFAERGDPDAVRDAFAALSEQLDVHFEQEDRLYYTSVGALRPELEPEIGAISAAHHGFRRELAAIGDRLERDDLPAALREIAALAEGFRRHEAMEESLLQRVEAEP